MSDIVWTQASEKFTADPPFNIEESDYFPGVPFRKLGDGGQELRLHRLQNVHVIWWNQGIRVFGSDGGLIESVSFEVCPPPDISMLSPREAITIGGLVASISQWNPRNYCHVLFEQLPLIEALGQANLLNAVDQILCTQWGGDFVKEALSFYGVRKNLLMMNGTGHAIFEDLLVFEEIRHPAHKCHASFMTFFDRIRAEIDVPSRKNRILITRPQSNRGFTNFDAMRRLLGDFDVVDLDKRLTIREQARIFKGADVVVAAHGAALANIVFSEPDSLVVEVFGRDYGTPAYWTTARARGLRYAALQDVRGPADYNPNNKAMGIEVDLNQLAVLVK